MNLLFKTLALTFFFNASTAFACSELGTFSSQDLFTGAKIEWKSETAKLATVIVFLSATCPCSRSHEPILAEMAARYQSQGVLFFAVHANTNEPLVMTQAHFRESKLGFSVLEDTDARLADVLGALKTPHAFVIDPKGKILYHGGIDDSQAAEGAKKKYLDEVLTALLDKRELPYEVTRTLGCVIQRKK